MPRVRRLVIAFTIATLLAGAAAPSRAQDDTVVRAEPAEDSVSHDDESFEVLVLADNVTNLGAFNVRLQFDEEIIRATSIGRTEFLGSSGREVVCSDPLVATDTVALQCVTLREEPAGVDGSGAIISVMFEPVKEGTSPLTLEAELSRPDGISIPAEVRSGRVEVEGEGLSMCAWAGIGGAAIAIALAVAAVGLMVRRRRTRREPAT